jgi:hypothetical protein
MAKRKRPASQVKARAAVPAETTPNPPRRPVITDYFAHWTAERRADHHELYDRMMVSPGWKLLLQVLADSADLRAKVRELVEEHGPGTGSPLSRFVKRFADPEVFDELLAMARYIGHGVVMAESELPVPSR